MTPLHTLDTASLIRGYAAQDFTPRDVLLSLFQHIETWESQTPPLGGLWQLDPDRALTEADASASRWKNGSPKGPLDGIPATIKELIASKGLPIPQGTVATPQTPAEADSPITARLHEAGAIIFARTTVPDIGMLSSGISSFHPLTRNPWDLAANPGGSSAGAAAAAAAGYGPLHIGTDIGGSVRLPAAWCGLVGFKPTLGRIPIDPYYIGRCAGPMVRTVEDAARAMATLSLPDARDATSLPYENIDWSRPIDSIAGLRIGLMMDAGCGIDLEPAIATVVERAAKLFEHHGATITPVKPVLDRGLLDGCDVFWQARAWAELLDYPDDRREQIISAVLDWAKRGQNVSGVDAVRGLAGSFTVRRRCAALFEDFDVVLSPVTPVVSFPADWASPVNDAARPFEHIAYTLPWNFSDQPAACLNAGFGPGFDGKTMPIGLQIITPRFMDQRALQLARWFEQHSDATIKHWPEPERSA